MKKINFPRIVWVSSIFLILIIILILVMNYKINYEYLIHNYLYFYECDTNLCVSQAIDNNNLVFSKYDCGYEECPEYIKKIDDNYLILTKNDKKMLYNYRKGKSISTNYTDYNSIINNKYVIIEKNNKQGLIDLDNKLIINPIYDEIGYKKNDNLTGYNLNSIIVKKNNLYGIYSYKDNKFIEEIKYQEEDINTLLEIIKNNN